MKKLVSFADLANANATGGKGRFTRQPLAAPRPLTRADRAFKQMFRDLLDLKVPRPDWRFSVRPSNMPFCQWEAMLAELYGSDSPTDQDSFARDFYVEVGHVAHVVTQRWLGRAGYLFGPYECPICRNVEVSQGEPKECPTGCKDPKWIYREINLKDADPSNEFGSAHADGLIRFAWMPERQYYLIDIKTCALHTLPKPEYGFTSDYHKKYLHQTAIYAHLMSRADDMEVIGTAFIMVPRDDPKQTTAIIYDQGETHGDIYHDAVKKARGARKAVETGNCTGLVRECQTRLDKPECPFHGPCWDRKRTVAQFEKRTGKLPILPDF